MIAKRGWALIQISEPSDALSYVLRCYYLRGGGLAGWHGVAGVGSFAQEGGKSLEWPPKRVRDQKGCRQLPPRQTGLLTVPSPVPRTQGQELGIASANRDWSLRGSSLPPQLSTRLWALVPSHPWLRLQNPLGRREEAQQAGSEQRAPAQPSVLHELSETDRHVGNSVRVGLGEAVGGQERSSGCLPAC